MSAPTTSSSTKEHPPEAPGYEKGGERFRQCAVAVVFNRKGEILVGQRAGIPGSWNFPQGGIEATESAGDAAARELYEEVGLGGADGRSVVKVGELPQTDACCYEAGGWLKGAGYKGQCLAFSLFFLGDEGPLEELCDLNGKNGEPQEFSGVKWAPLAEVCETVWEAKRAAYAYCLEHGGPKIADYLASNKL